MFIEHLLLSTTQGPVPRATQDEKKETVDSMRLLMTVDHGPQQSAP